MGVDIYALTGLKSATEDEGLTSYLYDNPDFPGRALPFASGHYTAEKHQLMLRRSYGGYNAWRNDLAVLAGYAGASGAWSQSGGPFWELINFSDCEGTLGTAVCAKLARDFAEYQAKADVHPDEQFRKHYNEMRAGFELAAANAGAVKFS